MTGASRRQRIQALLFAAIMVVSMVAAGIGSGLAGSVVAQPNATLVVDDDLSEPDNSTNFSSIQAAVDEAAENDATIEVHEGTYEESIVIDGTNNLTIQGVEDANGNSPVIVGDEANVGSQPHAAIQVDGNGPTQETTIEGFTIRNPDGHYGVYAGTGGSNSDVDGLVLKNNTIEDIATNISSHDPLSGSVSGLYVRAQYDSIIVEDNTIRNVNTKGDNSQNAVGLGFSSFIGDQAFADTDPGSETAENTSVQNNVVTNINGAEGSRTKGISFSGEFDGLTIANNTVTDISANTTDSKVFAITLTENPGDSGTDIDDDGTDGRIGPRNFEIRDNDIDELSGADKALVFVGGYEDLGDNHVVEDNNFLDTDAGVSRFAQNQQGFNPGDEDTLNAILNWWGSPNGPSAGKRNTYNDGNQGAQISDDITFTPWLDNSTDNGGEPFAPVTNGSDGQFASIGAAVDETSDGGSISAKSGTYIEEVEIDKPLTLESEGTAAETAIRLTQEEASSTGAPTVDILSPGVTVDGFTIQRNSTGNFAQGIRVSNGSESGDTVVVSNNIVENLNTTRSVDNGILVGDNNNDDTPANVIVRSNTVSEFPNGIGVTSKTSDEVVRNVTIRNNTLYDNGVGFGVSNVSGAGVESIEATQNNITQNSVGVYLFGNEDAGRLSFTDVNASEVSVNTNNIIDNTGEVPDPEGGVMSVPSSIVNNGANELDATLNYYGKSTTPNTSSAVRYDPVLTTSIENISTDSTSDIRQYGSYLELSSDDGSPIAVGFAAPPDGNASEVLGDVVDVPSTVYRYDNTADKFVSINGSYTPSTGEVLVIAPEETLNEETIIPIATVSETAAQPDSVDLTQGWNLVATGATNDPSGIAVADGGADGVINDASLQVQPAQPGAPSANTGAFEGTWLFVDADGQLFTGYTEDQSPSTYSEEVLEPDTDKTE